MTFAKTFTVHDAIEAAGFGPFQIILSVIGGFAWMADSMEVMLLSLLTPSLVCEWGIQPFEQALCITCVFAGWMISSPFWGQVCDRYGRKKGLIAASFMAAVFGVATSFTTSFAWFLAVRACVGFAVGGVPQAVTICSEFLPTAHRAKCIVFLKFFWAIGAAAEALLALVVMPSLGWRWLVALSSLPLALFGLSCWWLPESARFHVAHGRLGDARGTLERVARYNNRKLPEGDLISEHDAAPNTSIALLLHKQHRRSTIQIWILWAIVAFTYYGITLYTTRLFQSQDECHGWVPTNASSFIGNSSSSSSLTTPRCKELTSADYIDIVTTSFAELPGLILTMITVETIGRRATFALEFGIFSAVTLVLVACLSRTMIVIILFIARALMAGAFQCAYVYTPEVYPTSLRASGLGAAGGMGRIGSMLTPIVAQVLSGHNLIIPAIVYAAAGALGTMTAILLPLETRGRAMQDVQ